MRRGGQRGNQRGEDGVAGGVHDLGTQLDHAGGRSAMGQDAATEPLSSFEHDGGRPVLDQATGARQPGCPSPEDDDVGVLHPGDASGFRP